MPSHNIIELNNPQHSDGLATDHVLLIASGIDCDPLLEQEYGGSHIYRPGEKITRLTNKAINDVKSLGFSVLQVGVGSHYNSTVLSDGREDWQELDINLEILASHDTEVLLATGHYWIPSWMRDIPEAVALRCLEHDATVPILSIWSPYTFDWLDKCAQALSAHLKHSPARIRALAIMVCGDFGEAVFPAGMLNAGNAQIDESEIHMHADFWCNDHCARKDYVRFLQASDKRRGILPRMYDPFDPDLFPSPPKSGCINHTWLGFLGWYHASMTRYTERVVDIYRKHFPDTELVVWLGGGIEPHHHGQDNSCLPKELSKHRATVRSTAAGSQLIFRQIEAPHQSLGWAFQRNYPIVKRVATACNYYGVPFWLEPPYPPGLDHSGVSVRIFEAISCGINGYFEWTRTLQRQHETYGRLLKLLTTEKPIVDVAVYFPQIAHRSVHDSIYPESYWNMAAHLRALVDYDVVDDLLIRDGALKQYRVLMITETECLYTDVLNHIVRWVQDGGIVLVELTNNEQPDLDMFSSVEDLMGKNGSAQLMESDPIQVTNNVLDEQCLSHTLSQCIGRDQHVVSSLPGDVEPILSTPLGAVVCRRRIGNGKVYFTGQSKSGIPLLVSVLRDLIEKDMDFQNSAAYDAVLWMQGNAQLFATVLREHLILANLSDSSIFRQQGKSSISLAAGELAVQQR